MPARKSPAPAKKAVAKKTASAKSKSAAPALAKKVAAKKVAKKPAVDVDPVARLAGNICTAISEGELDGFLVKLDDALTDRINKRAQERKKEKEAAVEKPEAKKVSSAPKRKQEVAANVEPGKTYKVGVKPAALAGVKVKVVRFKEGDDSKVLVEVLADKPGYPKGKRVVLPVRCLVNAR